MTTPKITLGQRGETLAVEYLQQRGYTLVARNWRCQWGELDIVAQQADILVFVEVKTSRTDSETAFANLTPNKRARMLNAVYQYLDAHALSDGEWRLDAIAVMLPAQGQPQIEHVENAFDW